MGGGARDGWVAHDQVCGPGDAWGQGPSLFLMLVLLTHLPMRPGFPVTTVLFTFPGYPHYLSPGKLLPPHPLSSLRSISSMSPHSAPSAHLVYVSSSPASLALPLHIPLASRAHSTQCPNHPALHPPQVGPFRLSHFLHDSQRLETIKTFFFSKKLSPLKSALIYYFIFNRG